MTLMIAPIPNAAAGFHPTAVKSLKRVVKPIDKKVNVNAHVRIVLMGAVTSVLMISCVPEETFASNNVSRIDEIKNPRTNLGNLETICPAFAFVPALFFSKNVMEIKARTKHQIPMNMSRPITFINVKEERA